MKILKWIGAVSAVVLVVFFALFAMPLRYTIHTLMFRAMAPKIYRNSAEAEKTADQLFFLLQWSDWTNARKWLTADCGRVFSETMLRQKWQAIEAKHGKNIGWAVQHEKINILPDFVEVDYRLQGKIGPGKAHLRIVRQNAVWCIDKLTMTP